MPIQDLKHVVRELPGGGFVLVLNTGTDIGPESEAMLQALHSRSIGGIRHHLEAIAKRGPENFMSTYYVGYGDKSIGDCGTCTLFIEGVSMLVAKAIQDWPLYSGQESSTRYIDFASQPFVDPLSTEETRVALEALRSFYLKGVEALPADLMERYPRKEDEDEKLYTKAIKARAFDIMRAFLPSGATTNLAWHSNLRQIADKLLVLRHHPLAEVRTVAEAIEAAVLEAFPSSFGHKRYEATETYNAERMSEGYLFESKDHPDFAVRFDGIDRESLKEYREALETRPAKTELPKHMNECGMIGFDFLLDFGSFRDVQRQRAVTQRMPLVTMEHGFHPWYLGELTPELRNEAVPLLEKHRRFVDSLPANAADKQYYVPMGYLIPNRLTGTLPALVYLIELRTTRFVHPTLRVRAQEMGKALIERFGDYGLVLHYDGEPDRFDIGRGKHDIVAKE
jgi:thymidylate synthase ThyX